MHIVLSSSSSMEISMNGVWRSYNEYRWWNGFTVEQSNYALSWWHYCFEECAYSMLCVGILIKFVSKFGRSSYRCIMEFKLTRTTQRKNDFFCFVKIDKHQVPRIPFTKYNSSNSRLSSFTLDTVFSLESSLYSIGDLYWETKCS